MLIPKIFHGTYKAVTQQSRAVVKRLVAGEMLASAVRADDALESLETSAQIMLDHPYPGQGVAPAFYVSPLGEMLGEGLSVERRFKPGSEQLLFMDFLEHPWGLVSILGRHNAQAWLISSWRMQRYLEAVERHRPVLDAAGECFVGGTHSSTGRPWWSFPGGSVFALGNLGASRADVNELMDSGIIPDWRSLDPRLAIVS
jgi:hypothetical protein